MSKIRVLKKLLNIREPISDELKDLVEISVSKRAKKLSLKLDYQKRVVRLVVPKNVSARKAYEFASDHEWWIREKLEELPENVEFKDGVSIPVFGKDLIICISVSEEYKRTSIKICDQYITIKTNKDDCSSRLERYLKKQAGEKLKELAKIKAENMGKAIKSIQIRDTKTRWGSCSSDGSINFSWRLIFAPYEAMDYVVAHEVAHLTHMNHGSNFWLLCEKLCSDYSYGKKWMLNSGNMLMRYG